MTAPTRCPSCSAALAPGAAWCSLCHADLRPKLEPALRSLDVVPGAPAGPSAAVAVGAAATAVADPELDPVLSLEPADASAYDDEPEEPPVRGRHSRTDEEPSAPAPRSSGRHTHAHGRAPSARRRDRGAADAAGADPVVLDGRPLDPDDVDALADQMLSRLAVTEKRQRFFDPDDVPGGKPVFMAGAAVSVVLVLVFLFTLFGTLLGRH